ncbi:MAG: hypothetical protein OXQ29_24435 [Rhodospirillaceae bacterium]|nr:hypothetical protein [Rhodospirillaceae bacterium]
MPTLSNQQRRRRAIAELLRSHVIRRQSELVRLLRAEGLEATQSSISRDLRDLGVAKLTTGYSLPEPGRGNNADALRPVAEFVRELRAAGPNLLVIATAIGAAQRVCVTLDRANWPEVAGTISGDDTIFVATTGAGAQRRLVARLQELLRQVAVQ